MAKYKKDPAKVASKWSQNLANAASTTYVEGTQAVTEAPGVAAARQKAKMKAKINKALDDGTWEKKVAEVPLSEYQETTRTVGAQNLANAATQRMGNTQTFMEGWTQYTHDISKKISAMKGVTDADMDARMLANLKAMREGKGRFSKRRR